MPDPKTLERAEEDRREGKAPSTQAGEFVKEEFEHIREGKHGARSPKQAIAIGLSKARRAGVALQPPKKGTTSEKTRKSAERALKTASKARGKKRTISRRRSRAVSAALKREPRSYASFGAISRQAKSAAKRRSLSSRSAAARKAARTKGAAGRSVAARKAERTRSGKRRS